MIGKAELEQKIQNLVALGFTPQQAQKLIFRGSAAYGIDTLLNMVAVLLKAPYSLTQEQIIHVSMHGAKNIKALVDNLNDLRALGFAVKQAVKMVSTKAVQKYRSGPISLC